MLGEKLPKSKQPSNKSYNTLKTAVLDELVIAKLGFFRYLAGMFKPFLTAYQTDCPNIAALTIRKLKKLILVLLP